MKKTTRISALILILALLLNLSGAAFAAAEGIPIEDLDLSTLQMLTTAALEEEEAAGDSTVIDDPWGIGGACGDENVYCHIITNELVNMNAQKIYDYLDALYTKDLAEGEEGPSDDYAALMLHYGIYHLDLNIICTCGEHPLPLPQFELSDVSAHEPECPWHFNNLTTAEQYVMLKAADEAKKEELEASLDATAAEKLSRVNVGEYTASAEAVSVEISVPEGAFAESYILTAGEAELEAGEESALTEAGVTNVLASFDISFPSLQDEETELQPVEGASVPLTFTVDLTNVEGEALRVFHVKDDGTVEFVGEPVAIEEDAESMTIAVEAESFSTYGVVTDIWDHVDDDLTEDILKIGFLDKSGEEIIFVSDDEYLFGVPVEDCPDFLILTEIFKDESGTPILYTWESFDPDFYDTDAGYTNRIDAKYVTELVEPEGLFATFAPEEGADFINFYEDASENCDPVQVSVAEFEMTEFMVESIKCDYDWYVKLAASSRLPEAASGCYWIGGTNLASLSKESTQGDGDHPDVSVSDWEDSKNTVTLTYNYEYAVEGESYIYTWYQIVEKTDESGKVTVSWKVVEGDAVTDNKLILTMTEDDLSALTNVYKCVVTNGSGEILAISSVLGVVSSMIRDWISNDTDEIKVDLMMAKRAFEVGSLNKMRVKEEQLISVYTGTAVADIVEHDGVEGVQAKLVDCAMGLTVAYVTDDGMVISVDSVEHTEVEMTNA